MSLYLQAVAHVEAQKQPHIAALKAEMEVARADHLEHRTKATKKTLARAERAYTNALHEIVYGRTP